MLTLCGVGERLPLLVLPVAFLTVTGQLLGIDACWNIAKIHQRWQKASEKRAVKVDRLEKIARFNALKGKGGFYRLRKDNGFKEGGRQRAEGGRKDEEA